MLILREEGQGLAEFVIMIAIIAIVAIAALVMLAGQLIELANAIRPLIRK